MTGSRTDDLGQALIDRRRAYEESHPGRYFRPAHLTASGEWELMQEAGDDDTPDALLDRDPRLAALLDRLEAGDGGDGDVLCGAGTSTSRTRGRTGVSVMASRPT